MTTYQDGATVTRGEGGVGVYMGVRVKYGRFGVYWRQPPWNTY